MDLPPRPMPEALERGFFLGLVVEEGGTGVVSLREGPREEEEWEDAAAVGMLEGLLLLDAPLLPLLLLLLLLLAL